MEVLWPLFTDALKTLAALPPQWRIWVGVVLVGILLIWLILRARKPQRRCQPTKNSASSGWFRNLWLGLRSIPANIAKTLRYASTRREWRYDSPWVLLMGQPRSGKSSLAESISEKQRREPSHHESALPFAGSRWWFFNRGILIDPLSSGSEKSPTIAWSTLFSGLFDRRPERPLDAVVLVLPADILKDGNAAELSALAQKCFDQLVKAQIQFEFTFPVYVLVSQCDDVEGFDVFWKRQSEEVRKQILGWSNPYSLQQRYVEGWVDEAFESIDDSLRVLQVQAAAENSSTDEADRFFLFPQRFDELREPLGVVLKHVFQSSTYHEDFFFRGLYFSGSTEAAGGRSKETLQSVEFVESLFEEKIFAETHLAKPVRDSLWSKHQSARRLQIGVVGVFVLSLLALTWASFSLNRQVDASIAALELIKNPQLSETARGANECISRETVYGLLSNVVRIDLQLAYLPIPASWVDWRLYNRQSTFVADAAFSQVVFPSLRCQLEAKARHLLREVPPMPEHLQYAGEIMTERRQRLLNYLQEIEDYQANLRRFKKLRLASSTADSPDLMRQFRTLSEYVYGKALPEEVSEGNSQLLRALAQVSDKQAIQLPEALLRNVSTRIEERAWQYRAALTKQLNSGPTFLKALQSDTPPYMHNARSFVSWMRWVQAAWMSQDTDPCLTLQDKLRGPVQRLITEYSYPVSLNDVSGLFGKTQCSRPARNTLAGLKVAPHGSLFEVSGSVLKAAPSLQKEVDGFGALVEQGFMQGDNLQPFQCAKPLVGWDGAYLSQAMGSVREYQDFVSGQKLTTASVGERPLYDQVARRQLQLTLGDTMNRAQISVPWSQTSPVSLLNPVSAQDELLKQRSYDFNEVLDPLVMLLGMYQQLGFEGQQAAVSQCTRDFSSNSLGGINILAESSRVYEPGLRLSRSSRRDGLIFDLGSDAQTKDYLQRQLQRSRILAAYAEPFVAFLVNTDGLETANKPNRETEKFWNKTISELNGYIQFKETNGQVAHIDELIGKQLVGMTPENCRERLDAYKAPSVGNDLFSERREVLEKQASMFCKNREKVGSYVAYRGVSRSFGLQLGGYFPFGGNPDQAASLTTVKQFFLDYGKNKEEFTKQLEGMSAHSRKKVESFIKQLDEVDAFFATNLAAGDISQPLQLKIGFRAREKRSPGSDQLIRWRFTSGSRSIEFPNGENTIEWQYGDPLSLEFDWAGLSKFAPQDHHHQGDLTIKGRTAAFRADGPWALFDFIDKHCPHLAVGSNPLDPSTLLLEFDVPVQSTLAEGQAPKTTTSRMYITLQLLGVDPKTKNRIPVRIPTFPDMAPNAW